MISKNWYTADEYIKDVLADKFPVGKYARLAVIRHVQDLERQGSKDFPYYFDEKKAKTPILFKMGLQHIKGKFADPRFSKSLFFNPEPWQQFCDAVLYGWVNAAGLRRFTKSYRSVAKKNGKTFEAAGNALFALGPDKEQGSEVYAVATKKDQAKIVWDAAKEIIKKSKTLTKNYRSYRNTILSFKNSGSFVPLGRDSKTSDGFNPHFGIVDEYHAHTTSSMYDIVAAGMGSRAQPMMYVITTAGFDISFPCYLEENYVKQILDRSIINERYFGIVYSMDEKDDIVNPDNWYKANPNLGVSVDREWLKGEVNSALTKPSAMNGVLTKNLNVWTNAVSRWLNFKEWQACNTEKFDQERLIGRKCFLGLDLSTTTDLCSAVCVFPPDDDNKKWLYHAFFYVPETGVLERGQKDKVDYQAWIKQGYIVTTPGNVVDYKFILADVLRISELYDIVEIAYDPYNATSLIIDLQEEHIAEIVEFRQGFLTMSPAAKSFERSVQAEELEGCNNPVMTWMANNATIKTDPAGNIKPIKPDRTKTGARIDGIISLIMGKWRAELYVEEKYRNEGLIII